MHHNHFEVGVPVGQDLLRLEQNARAQANDARTYTHTFRLLNSSRYTRHCTEDGDVDVVKHFHGAFAQLWQQPAPQHQ